ncbi:MAG: cytochrome b N-terminal domain-containing protein, partial [Acidobacteria bacterium]|nr:cytochrome b N-terminal domain-containing protein [Acidobacteriota bacterium]
TDKGKSELVFLNLWLHIHPVKVRKEHFKLKHTWYLGFITFYLFLVLVTTGVALMFYYRPYSAQAYQDMKDLQFVVFLGPFLRNVHRWSAHGMVICVFLHMCRVFYTGSYKKPRQFNWTIGVFLFLLTLGLSFTGYLLPWDQLAFWAITVGTNIGSYAPLIGTKIKLLLLGGHAVGESALLRFYVLHVVVLPTTVALLTMVHFWRIRKDGGLSRPVWKLENGEVRKEVIVTASTQKTYGLMAVVTGKPLFEMIAAEEDGDLVFSYPYAFFREAIAMMVTLATVMAVSLFWNAPLEEIANAAKTPNPAKAPWYFLGLQELVSHSALIGGVIAPALLVLALLAIPYLDSNPSRRPAARKWAIWVFTVFVIANIALIVIGTYFRGPGWALVPPWVHVVGAE